MRQNFLNMSNLRSRYAHCSTAVKFFQWLGIMIVSGLAVMFLVVLLFPTPLGLQSLKLFQAIQSLAIFVMPPFVVAYLWSARPLEWLGLSSFPSWRITVSALLWLLVAIPGINLLAYWNSHISLPEALSGLEQMMQLMEERAASLTKQFLETATVAGLCVNILVLAFLPALGEELSFRSVLLRLFGSTSAAIWAMAVIFSALHGQFYGFVPRMLMGVVFGYMVVWSGSLWTSVSMHFLNNALAVVTAYICTCQGIDVEVLETFGTGSTAWAGYLSLVLAVVGIVLLKRWVPVWRK